MKQTYEINNVVKKTIAHFETVFGDISEEKVKIVSKIIEKEVKSWESEVVESIVANSVFLATMKLIEDEISGTKKMEVAE